MPNMPKKESEWRERLTPEQYAVLREKGTEAPFTGKLLHEKRDGMYTCVACGNPLFTSDAKFDSGSGWPSFEEALPGSIKLLDDTTHGMSRLGIPNVVAGTRTEVVCAQCGSHLGHLFNDGPTPSGQRYCLNSVCLAFGEGEK